MTALLETTNPFWAWLVRASWQAGALALLVLAAQWVFRNQLAPRWRCALWWLVVIRLILPVSPASSVSVFNWIGWRENQRLDAPAKTTVSAVEAVPAPTAEFELRDLSVSDLPASPAPLLSSETTVAVPASAATSAKPVESRGHSAFPWRRVAVWSWLAGVVILAMHLGWSLIRLRGALRRAKQVTDFTAIELLDRCRVCMGVRRRLPVLETPAVSSPALCGLFRPRLLLPPGLTGQFTERELRFVFLHELAHLKRHDIATNWLTTLLQVLHWFNPLVWLAFARMRAERELACDALALAHAQPDESRAYGQTIIKLLEGFTRPAALPGLVGILEDRSQMKRRIAMIVCPGRVPRSSLLALVLLCALAATGLTDARIKPAASVSTAPASVTRVEEALRRDPENQVATHYVEVARGRQGTSEKRKALLEKLDRIRLESAFLDELPLSEVVRQLSKEVRRRDPEGRGVDFLLAGSPSSEHRSIDAVLVKVLPAQANLSLLEALEVITRSAEPAIKYSVEDHGVVFSFRGSEAPVLHTRTFKLDPTSLTRGLDELLLKRPGRPATNGSPTLSGRGGVLSPAKDFVTATNAAEDSLMRLDKLKQFLAVIGVDLSPPKTVFFNDRLGMLMVRASPSDLDTIEQAVQLLNASPPQVTIEAKFVEVTEDEKGGRDFLALLGFAAGMATPAPVTNEPPRDPRVTTAQAKGGPGGQSAPTEDRPHLPPSPFTCILTPSEFQDVIKALERRNGVDLLTTPRVTTVSGRQAQIKVVDVRYVVTGLRETKASDTLTPVTEPLEFGPVLDIVPHVSADNSAIQMTVIPTIKEFLGYDEDGKRFPTGTSSNVGYPLPKFRVRQVSASATLRDGQTLVLGAGTIEDVQPPAKKASVPGNAALAERSSPSDSAIIRRKSLFIFITPTLIDAAGNPIHAPEEMGRRGRGMPPGRPAR